MDLVTAKFPLSRAKKKKKGEKEIGRYGDQVSYVQFQPQPHSWFSVHRTHCLTCREGGALHLMEQIFGA